MELTAIPPVRTDKVYKAFGDEYTFHLGPDETGGRITTFTGVTPPGGGPPPHIHENEEEWFVVLEGEAEFLRGSTWTKAPAGSAMFVPRGEVHTFRNSGDSPLKMLVNTSPCGFEVFIGRCAEEFAKPGAPDMARLMQIAIEHGIRFCME